MKVISVEQMRELDRLTIESGTPGEVLMERAGVGAAHCILDFVEKLAPVHVQRFVLLAGKGNNGGDAYVVARHLWETFPTEVIVYSVCPITELQGDALLNAERLPEEIVCEVKDQLTTDDFGPGDIIIDGLLGTGISGPLREPYENWINVVNAAELPVIALDIPSGLNGDDGSIATAAIIADLTVTMGLPKTGMYLGAGPEYCGRLRCIDIGVPKQFIDEVPSALTTTFASDLRHLLGRLPFDSHKYTHGAILVIGGSRSYPGAPFLTAEAALRSGAGLVTLAVPVSARIPPGNCRSLIFRQVDDNGNGVFGDRSIPELKEMLEKVSSVAIGPGLSNAPDITLVIKFLNTFDRPVVYDADALNLVAAYPELWQRHAPTVITPHPGEIKRLLFGFGLGDLVDKGRQEQAAKLAERLNSTVVLKGNRTVIADADGRLVVNSSGGPALGTAGSGDVLTGIIGAFLARKDMDSFTAATGGVFIHGLASELSNNGIRGLIADDLIEIVDLIPQAMKEISPFA